MDEKLLIAIRDYIKIKTGIFYFKDIKRTGDNLMVTCPFHKGGQERKPSAGIRITESPKVSVGTFHCFTCGEEMGISQVVEKLLGNLYDEDEVESRFQLKLKSIQASLIKEKVPDLFVLPNPNEFTYNEKELRNYRIKTHPYLENRRITEDTIRAYDIGYDINNRQITFPIRDVYRYCLGVGRRSIDRKEYRYPPGMSKPLYGIYELPKKVVHLWVVEGPFNLWSLYGWGKNGVALLGTGTESQYRQLLNIDCVDYVLALDPDDAGRKGIFKLAKFLHRYKKDNIYVALIPERKDINDLTYNEFNTLEAISIEQWKYMFPNYN